MVDRIIEGLIVTQLREIATLGGNVFHALKSSDEGYAGFGEAYFSTIQGGMIKPWKRHKQMTLNLVVPIGVIRFVLYDDRVGSSTKNQFTEVMLGNPGNYARLTVPPKVWMAFQGVAEGASWLMNIANIPHDPAESDRLLLNEISYEWSRV
jgi:dTDP-4-dehydrorhamnose 3,5-epimerase